MIQAQSDWIYYSLVQYIFIQKLYLMFITGFLLNWMYTLSCNNKKSNTILFNYNNLGSCVTLCIRSNSCVHVTVLLSIQDTVEVLDQQYHLVHRYTNSMLQFWPFMVKVGDAAHYWSKARLLCDACKAWTITYCYSNLYYYYYYHYYTSDFATLSQVAVCILWNSDCICYARRIALQGTCV